MAAFDIALPDGRTLGIHEYGDPDGRPVVFFHGGGLGATGAFAASCDSVARQLHLRVLAPDRPGLGDSSPSSGRTVLDWPDDVASMANTLGVDRFPVVAHSGGAAYALVCAWKLRRRVSSVVLCSAVAPRPMVSWEKSIPLSTKLQTWFVASAPAFLLRFMLSRFAKGMAQRPEKTIQAFVRGLPACERAIVGKMAENGFLRDCATSALKQGPAPVVEDLRLIVRDWAFPLEEVQQPVTLWHGEADTTAMPESAQLLAGKLPAARMHLFADAGHLTAWLCHAQETLGSM